MVAKHYKRDISLQALRHKMQIGKEGVNLLGISEAAEAVGFRTQAVKFSFKTLVKEAKLTLSFTHCLSQRMMRCNLHYYYTYRLLQG